MKVSLNWVKDYVKLPDDMDLKRLSYDLTMSTVEVEDATDLSESFRNMVIGVVQQVQQHPNADKLRVCKTDIGGEIKDIVCGGINLRDGMKVAVALPGAHCRWHGEGEPVEIKVSKLRGVESYGMICASSETSSPSRRRPPSWTCRTLTPPPGRPWPTPWTSTTSSWRSTINP